MNAHQRRLRRKFRYQKAWNVFYYGEYRPYARPLPARAGVYEIGANTPFWRFHRLMTRSEHSYQEYDRWHVNGMPIGLPPIDNSFFAGNR